MAIGKTSDFQIYQEEFFGGMSEVIEQEANAFNAASNNSLILTPTRLKGDYEKESFIKSIAGLVSRRDTTATTDATDIAMTMGEHVSVKVNRKIGPVAQTLDAWRKLGEDPSTMSFQLGKQIGKAVALDYVNTAITAAVAALKGVAALKHDGSLGTITHTAMNQAMAKRGDAANALACWVMHSKAYFDLIGQQIADKLYEVASATVYAGTVATFGKPVVVTDAPGLWDANGSATDTYNTLCLVPGAVNVKQSEAQEIVSQLITGKENLVMRIQGEYAFNVGITGFAWDVTNGGANPADAAIGTSTNWDSSASNNKSRAGVLLVTQ
ncbi:MAG: major capsid protein [Deltaproteobacteria bacterium]|nr:major capsid protein [Deltaproteobacteria bacterium]